MTRIAVITDIHHGLPNRTKCGGAALNLLDAFAQFVADEQPDVVLDLGDRINDVDADTDRHLAAEVAEIFAAMAPPVYHICGNHDRDHLTVAENVSILNQDLNSTVIDLGAWQLALWRADCQVKRGGAHGLHLKDDDLTWLANMSEAATKPTLIASHVPISGQSQIGNYYFQNTPNYATYPSAGRARVALERGCQPMVMISGHVHWNSAQQVGGIWHLTQQSLTETYSTNGVPAGAWSLLTLGDTVDWSVKGLDPFAATLSPKATRWAEPIPPFA